jgi:hypothetical protein
MNENLQKQEKRLAPPQHCLVFQLSNKLEILIPRVFSMIWQQLESPNRIQQKNGSSSEKPTTSRQYTHLRMASGFWTRAHMTFYASSCADECLIGFELTAIGEVTLQL